jgi:hypothetical protein
VIVVAADWVTISALATRAGRSSSPSPRSRPCGPRTGRLAWPNARCSPACAPLLIPSRPDDPQQKVSFADEQHLVVDGAGAAAEVGDDAVYVAISLRNAGAGIAVLHGWHLYPERRLGATDQPPVDDFTRLTRDIYIPAGDVGFWQGTFRDRATPAFAEAAAAIEGRQPLTVDVLYGDHEGGQRTITRFGLLPRRDGGWIAAASRHWNFDRSDPR